MDFAEENAIKAKHCNSGHKSAALTASGQNSLFKIFLGDCREFAVSATCTDWRTNPKGGILNVEICPDVSKYNFKPKI